MAREPLMVLRAGMTEGLRETGLVTWSPLVATRGSSGRRPLCLCSTWGVAKRASRLSSLAGGSPWSLGLPRGLVDRAWPTTLQRSERALLS